MKRILEPELMDDEQQSVAYAAFTPDEVRQQLRDAGLELTVALTGVRHMLVKGMLSDVRP